jgi:hypothetical protein
MMLDPEEPLWLPRGSVRAILALFVTIVGIGFLIAADMAEPIIGFVGLALGYYFAKRDAEQPVD